VRAHNGQGCNGYRDRRHLRRVADDRAAGGDGRCSLADCAVGQVAFDGGMSALFTVGLTDTLAGKLLRMF
jgi:hypothetical protein